MCLNLVDQKLSDNRYFYFSLLAIMYFSVLLCYGEIPYLRRSILRNETLNISLKTSHFQSAENRRMFPSFKRSSRDR